MLMYYLYSVGKTQNRDSGLEKAHHLKPGLGSNSPLRIRTPFDVL